jgi:hypothetical protein
LAQLDDFNENRFFLWCKFRAILIKVINTKDHAGFQKRYDFDPNFRLDFFARNLWNTSIVLKQFLTDLKQIWAKIRILRIIIDDIHSKIYAWWAAGILIILHVHNLTFEFFWINKIRRYLNKLLMNINK